MGQKRITKHDCAHVAALARLQLTDKELERFSVQLGELLDHVAEVESLDIADLAPTMHPFELFTPMRLDEPGEVLDSEEVLSQAPHFENGQFRVPPVLGEAL